LQQFQSTIHPIANDDIFAHAPNRDNLILNNFKKIYLTVFLLIR